MSIIRKVTVCLAIGVCGLAHAGALVTSADTVDLNGDKLLDLAVAQPERDAVSIFFGKDENTFRDPVVIPMSAPVSVRYADMDGDGREELLALSQLGSELTVIWFDKDGLPEALNSQVLDRPASQILTLRDVDRKTSMVMLASLEGSLWELGRADMMLDIDDGTTFDQGAGLSPNPDENVAFAFPPDIRDYRVPYFPDYNDVNQCGGGRSPSDSGACARSPQDPGIQACLDASWCRWADCTWAACILRQSGQISRRGYLAALLTCTSVHIMEMVACAPNQILN